MNILITGAYGFIGTNLSRYLTDKGHVLSALDVYTKDSSSYQRSLLWDDFDMIDFDEFDVIIHLAGKAHDTRDKGKEQEYFDINTGLTQKIFDKFLQSKVQSFIFFSSVKAAADKIDGNFLTEDIIPAPIGPYGESKIRAEEYIQSKKWGGKNVYIFRPCMIHGPGNKGNLNLLYGIVKKGAPYPLGTFNNQRSFLNIWNLSFTIEQFVIKQPESGVYHLADDSPISTNELINLIAESLNKKPKIWCWNKSFVRVAARIGTFLRLPLNSERLQKLTENYIVSNQKVKKTIGVEEMPVSVNEGLKKTLEYFKNGI